MIHRFIYPNWTIAGAYARNACPHDNPYYVSGGNFTVVEQVLNHFQPIKIWPAPDPDTIVLHLRLGDMMEMSKDDPYTMLTKGGRQYK